MPIPFLISARILLGSILLVIAFQAAGRAANLKEESDAPPAVGDEAEDFELSALDESKVKLSSLTEEGPVVLIVLRGYPGYQCPICSQQVASLLREKGKLRDAGAAVVLVYPGPAKDLKQHGEEFVRGKTLPDNFHLVIDPDYEFTSAYRLRWDESGETAYPSTFVIDKDRKIRFAKISKTHGGRSSVDEVLKALAKL
jgi:peroxiredoxin